MIHSFDSRVAEEYGVEKAILLYDICYWLEHNEASGQNFYEGKYWTYNTCKAWAELMPYFSPKKIERLISSLVEDGLIEKGNFNETKLNHTQWITLTSKGKISTFTIQSKAFSDTDKNGKSNRQNCRIESTDLSNHDIYIHNNYIHKERYVSNDTYREKNPLDALDDDVLDAFRSFSEMRKRIKKPMTDNAVDRMVHKLLKLSDDKDTQIAILHQSEDYCWTDIYPLRVEKGTKENPVDRLERLRKEMADES